MKLMLLRPTAIGRWCRMFYCLIISHVMHLMEDQQSTRVELFGGTATPATLMLV